MKATLNNICLISSIIIIINNEQPVICDIPTEEQALKTEENDIAEKRKVKAALSSPLLAFVIATLF